MLRPLLLTFIPLFVAVDVVGLVVIYLGIALPFDEADRRRLVGEATMTAGAVGVSLLFAGDAVLSFLGVTVGDFLTTLLTLARTHGYLVTLLGFALNLGLVWAALRWALVVERVLGEAGCRDITKVLHVLLAALAVTFVRRRVTAAWTN
jgi:multiple antibiotic resistance protein